MKPSGLPLERSGSQSKDAQLEETCSHFLSDNLAQMRRFRKRGLVLSADADLHEAEDSPRDAS